MSELDLCFLTATELAGRIATKDVSAREVMTAHLEQIEHVNPKVNAIVTLVAEQAMAAAAKADEALAHDESVGPLHAVSYTHLTLPTNREV